ncbi:MAG: glycosyltransferase [Bacteroidota bacterium]|nr:glycosyltransferase [Bacteroidota bacterium]
MNRCAPIALFVYNRLTHVERAVEALKRNELMEESDLFIFSDAWKKNDLPQSVADVRLFIHTISGFKSVTIIERDKNYGLANSIIEGVSSLVDRFGKVIVVEDDLVTSKYFLRYMNEALTKYEHEEKIISIHGYCYPTKQKLPETFFLCGADCWGWATWKRAWKFFEHDGGKLLNRLQEKELQHRFDFDGTYNYTKMLKKQIAGTVDSWAVRWHASAFLHDKLTLYPGRSLVNNIGGDDLGTHTKSLDGFQTTVAQSPVHLSDIPIVENEKARQAYIEFFRSVRESPLQRIKNKLRSHFST